MVKADFLLLKRNNNFWNQTVDDFFIKTLLFQKLLLRFNNKNIISYHISNDFLQFSKRWSKKQGHINVYNMRNVAHRSFRGNSNKR